MSKQVRLRRGTTAQHSSFTGAQGEVTVDTDKKVVVVHDGSTAGGTPMFSSTGGTITGMTAFGAGLKLTGPATLGAAAAKEWSYEHPVTRYYFGDGSGYSFALSKRVGSTTTDLLTLTDEGGLKLGPDATGYSTSEPLAVVKDAASAVNAVVRNNSTSASASAGIAVNAYGNSWRVAVGSTAKNSNSLTFEVDALGSPVVKLALDTTGNTTPGSDNGQTLGDGSFRWSTVYAATGTINTSDKREKTPLRKLNSQEIACGLELAQTGCGVFQWLNSVEEKGADNARLHVGYTVQDVIAVMRKHNLNPFRYAFICYDQWEDKFVEHPAVEADPENGVEAREAFTEQIQVAGDRYGFRADQLDRFIYAAVIQFFLSGGKL